MKQSNQPVIIQVCRIRSSPR